MTQDGKSAARAALEALAIEAYRSGAFTGPETRRILGFGTQYELDGFLKDHAVEEGAYDIEDLEQDLRASEHLAQ